MRAKFRYSVHWSRTQNCHVYVCDYRRGFGLQVGFTDHFNTRIVTSLNYSAIADLRTLQTTTAQAKSPVCCVFTSRFLVTVLNNEDSSTDCTDEFFS
jgi:hypothetical protein